ncbi:sugar transferase [bacterium]|nr:sugar transferase [bacterium]
MGIKLLLLGVLKALHTERLLIALTVSLGWGVYLAQCEMGEQLSSVMTYLFCLGSGSIALFFSNDGSKNAPLSFWPQPWSLLSDFLLISVLGLLSFVIVNQVWSWQAGYQIHYHTQSLIVGSSIIGVSAGIINLLLAWVLNTLGYRKTIIFDLTEMEEKALREEVAGLSEKYRPKLYNRKKATWNGCLPLRDVDLYVISRSTITDFTTENDLIMAHVHGIPIADFSSLMVGLRKRISVPETGQWCFLMDARRQTFAVRCYRDMKMVLEPLLAFIILVVLTPLFLCLALLIKVSSRGPVLYRQLRLGYQGTSFFVLKLRTMNVDAERGGPRWAQENDERITPLGRYLRRFRLDELPQLVNIIRGEMSFVGPRPERPEIYSKLEPFIPQFRQRVLVRPGVTGWAQVQSGYAASIEESHTKLEYDFYYIQNMSPLLDLHIILLTISTAICGEKVKKHSERPILCGINKLPT